MSWNTLPALHEKPILRGWSHALAAVAAIALCPIVIVTASGARSAAAIYTSAVIGLFGVSALYHRFGWSPRLRDFMRRLDHTMIFVMIAATYTPIAVVALPARSRNLVLVLTWAGAAVGAIWQWFWPDISPRLQALQYAAVGWVALLVLADIWDAMGVAGFVLLLSGGVAHTLGAVIFAMRRPDPWPRVFGFHEIFHLLVIAAVAQHYVAVTFFAIPLARA